MYAILIFLCEINSTARKLALFRKSFQAYHSEILQVLRNINSVEGFKDYLKKL